MGLRVVLVCYLAPKVLCVNFFPPSSFLLKCKLPVIYRSRTMARLNKIAVAVSLWLLYYLFNPGVNAARVSQYPMAMNPKVGGWKSNSPTSSNLAQHVRRGNSKDIARALKNPYDFIFGYSFNGTFSNALNTIKSLPQNTNGTDAA
ncbi:hypothetical protein F5Y16DRAFT_166952 [Xylariaceae sp. FL0255]|nr:hypothetical protein F5Y16DRAFT_166952 [Xylariaceae sp. FL0255]